MTLRTDSRSCTPVAEQVNRFVVISTHSGDGADRYYLDPGIGGDILQMTVFRPFTATLSIIVIRSAMTPENSVRVDGCVHRSPV